MPGPEGNKWLIFGKFFAENSTSSDEYGLTTAANYRLLRHRIGAEFCLHVQPDNQE